MVSSTADVRLETLGQSLVDLVTQFCLAVPRGRRRAGDLKEVEFLTLSILQQHDTLIVGEIQRHLGILPAQMSRIIRSLESRDPPLIHCQINTHDKRKIDVSLTPDGVDALHRYQANRTRNIAGVLEQLPEEDLGEMHRLIQKVQDLIRR
jgi:DNA-binding MarR family transcriptional regulator